MVITAQTAKSLNVSPKAISFELCKNPAIKSISFIEIKILKEGKTPKARVSIITALTLKGEALKNKIKVRINLDFILFIILLKKGRLLFLKLAFFI